MTKSQRITGAVARADSSARVAAGWSAMGRVKSKVGQAIEDIGTAIKKSR